MFDKRNPGIILPVRPWSFYIGMEVESQAQRCLLLESINVVASSANLLNPKHENGIDESISGRAFPCRLDLCIDDLNGKVLVLHSYNVQLPNTGRIFEQWHSQRGNV